MKKYNVLKAAAIMCTILYVLTGTFYADNHASQFNDIDNSWAKQYIINVYNKGLMGGFSKTEFKPGEYVKNYDALVSISRMIKREKDINLEKLEEKYRESVLDKFNVPDYAREHIIVCIGEGIISDADVSMFDKYPYATKNSIMRYLGKAFGVKVDEDAPPVALEFIDALDVPILYKPYVKYLIDSGIIDPYSETNSRLNPKSNVDRAVFAKIMDLSSDFYEKKATGSDTVDTTPKDILSDPDITWTDIESPGSAEIIEDGVQTDVIANGDGVQADVIAYVDQIIPEYGNLAVFVGTERRVYKLAEDVVCTIDDAAEGFWKLRKSDRVKLFIKSDKITKILAESKIRKTVGKLLGIQSEDKTVLRMETSMGEIQNYTITAKTIVIKDGKGALWQELKEGNSLVITTSYDELIEINADGVKSTDKGIIESLVLSRIAPPKIVVTALDGSQNTYYTSKDIEISGAGSDIYSLRPGMQAEVSLIDDEIVKIGIINEAALVLAELKGVIKSIDTEAGLLIMEIYESSTNKYSDKKIYVNEETKIADSYLNFLGLSSLEVNQIITVRGTGTAEGVYAKAIQVMD